MSLARIAAALNLSITTVSRALAGYSDVSAKTRARVVAEAARINYRPNQDARRLRLGRADAVGLVMPTGVGQFDDPFFLRLLGAVGPGLAAKGLDLLVCAAPEADEIAQYRHFVESRRVDGFLVARMRARDPRVAYLQEAGVPFVTHGRTESDRPYAWVDTDGTAAAALATRRLVGLGHRRIVLINAQARYSFARFREAGWRAAMAEAHLETPPVVICEATEAGGFDAMHGLLGGGEEPTAVLCATDRMAVGALHAIAQTGLRAGRDISVIGYDDLPMSAHTDPPLTTLAQPFMESGARMVEMLVALLGGAEPESLQTMLQARLIVRASDGPAPGTGLHQKKKPEETHDLDTPRRT